MPLYGAEGKQYGGQKKTQPTQEYPFSGMKPQSATVKTPVGSVRLVDPRVGIGQAIAKEKATKQMGIGIESGSEYRTAKTKLTQTYALATIMNKKTTELMGGIEVPPALGMRWAANNLLGKVLKANQWVKTYEGDQYSTAAALMRAVMPGRAEKMVEGFKRGLPDVGSSDEEIDAQVIESMKTAIGDFAAKNPQQFMEYYGQGGQPINENSISALLMAEGAKAAEELVGLKQLLLQTPEEALTPTGILMRSPQGKQEIIPFVNAVEFVKSGYIPQSTKAKTIGGGVQQTQQAKQEIITLPSGKKITIRGR